MRASINKRFAAMVVAGCAATTAARSAEPGFWDRLATFNAAPDAAWRELSLGASVSKSSWAVYGSSTFAPFGALGSDGWRLRFGGGYGHYLYEQTRHCYDLVLKVETFPCASARYKGRVTFGDILAGYQLGYGQFTAKVFAGVAIDTQAVTPWDAANPTIGRVTGFKVALETWTNITPTVWLQADGSLTGAHDQRAALMRLGYRFTPAVSLGPEASYFQNAGGNSERVGAFARYEWSGGEAVLSGGINVDGGGDAMRKDDRFWASFSTSFKF